MACSNRWVAVVTVSAALACGDDGGNSESGSDGDAGSSSGDHGSSDGPVSDADSGGDQGSSGSSTGPGESGSSGPSDTSSADDSTSSTGGASGATDGGGQLCQTADDCGSGQLCNPAACCDDVGYCVTMDQATCGGFVGTPCPADTDVCVMDVCVADGQGFCFTADAAAELLAQAPSGCWRG